MIIDQIREEWPGAIMQRWITEIFPPGTADLQRPRCACYMDELGVDVQVIFPPSG